MAMAMEKVHQTGQTTASDHAQPKETTTVDMSLKLTFKVHMDKLQTAVISEIPYKWREIATAFGFTYNKMEIIESNNSKDQTRMYETFSEWLRRSDGTGGKERTLQTVCDVLKDRDCVIETDKLKDILSKISLNNSAPDDMNCTSQFPDSLVPFKKNVYFEYCKFKLGAGTTDIKYVKLAILKNKPSAKYTTGDSLAVLDGFRDCGSKGEIDRFINPEELLKKSANRKSVLYGHAGMGKTTALQHIAQQVAIQKYESDFTLILYFPIRDGTVGSATDLKGLLSYYGSDCDIASVEKELLDRRGKDVLLVFDGADEAKELIREGSPNVLLPLLKGRILPEASIILSSRPGVCPDLQNLCSTFYEIQGFDSVAIKVLVESFFKEDPQKGEEMLRALEERPDLMAGAYVPMNLFIFCSIYEPGQSYFPPTMTSCYSNYVSQVLLRECKKEGRECHINSDLSTLPEDLSHLLTCLGKLSFDGLAANPSCFIFSENTIRRIFPSLGNEKISESYFKGLLQVHAGKKGYNLASTFSFSHVTLQEFLAAFHLQELPQRYHTEFWKMHLMNPTFSIVLRFFAGLTGLSSRELVKQLTKPHNQVGLFKKFLSLFTITLPSECDCSNPQLLFLFHALYESQNRQLTENILKNLDKSIKFHDHLSPFDAMVVSYCLSQCSHLTALSFGDAPFPLKHWKTIIKANKGIPPPSPLIVEHLSEEDVKSAKRLLKGLEKLEVSIIKSTSVHALTELISVKGLEELALQVYKCTITNSEYSQLTTFLFEKCTLKSLDIRGTVPLLFYQVLQMNTSITRLDVWYANGYEILPVFNMTQLSWLELWETDPLPVLDGLCQREDAFECLEICNPPNYRNWPVETVTAAFSKAKIKRIGIMSNFSSMAAIFWRAVSDGLARNDHVKEVRLWGVPDELHQEMKRKLKRVQLKLIHI